MELNSRDISAIEAQHVPLSELREAAAAVTDPGPPVSGPSMVRDWLLAALERLGRKEKRCLDRFVRKNCRWTVGSFCSGTESPKCVMPTFVDVLREFIQSEAFDVQPYSAIRSFGFRNSLNQEFSRRINSDEGADAWMDDYLDYALDAV